MLAPDGFPQWVSQAEPGSVHDLTARVHALPALYRAAATGSSGTLTITPELIDVMRGLRISSWILLDP